jgi:hypothetical protein
VAAEPKAAFGGEFHRAHSLEVQINHWKTPCIETFVIFYQKFSKFPGDKKTPCGRKFLSKEIFPLVWGQKVDK